jgi:O-succinylbenzoate synthase
MLTLSTITLRLIQLKLKHPFKTAKHTLIQKPCIVIETPYQNDSIFSECVALPIAGYTNETVETARHTLIHTIIPLILNKTFQHPSDVATLLNSKTPNHPMANASIEMLFWQLAALKQNQSLARFIGGTQNHIPVGIAIGIQDSSDKTIANINDAIQKGYKKIKLKITPNTNFNIFKDIRKHIGPSFPLMVDANGSFNMNHISLLKQLDPFNLSMIEQPFEKNAFDEHHQLQQELKTPICLDESIETLADTHQLIEKKSGHIVTIKPGRVGGLSNAIEIAKLCKKNNIALWCGGMLETGIGRAYNVAFASLKELTLPSDLAPSSHYWDQDIVVPEWTMSKNGTVAVPFNKPGLGVDINYHELKKVTLEKLTLS